jgi:asparagine synthase (glutamine-hydrolysing)
MCFDNFASIRLADQQGLLAPGLREAATRPGAYGASLAHFQTPGGGSTLLDRLLYADIKTYLVELLMKQDQMSMAASIESRVPFLDHALVEFTAGIPAEYSIQGMAGKFILKQAVEDLLPKSIVYRKKMGFPTPWEYWLGGPQLDDLERMLLEPRSTERKLFRPEVVKRIFAEHRTKVRDNGNGIWRLINLEIWQRVMIDCEPVEAAAAHLSSSKLVALS